MTNQKVGLFLSIQLNLINKAGKNNQFYKHFKKTKKKTNKNINLKINNNLYEWFRVFLRCWINKIKIFDFKMNFSFMLKENINRSWYYVIENGRSFVKLNGWLDS